MEPVEQLAERFDDLSDDELRDALAEAETGADEHDAMRAELDARILPRAGEGGDY